MPWKASCSSSSSNRSDNRTLGIASTIRSGTTLDTSFESDAHKMKSIGAMTKARTMKNTYGKRIKKITPWIGMISTWDPEGKSWKKRRLKSMVRWEAAEAGHLETENGRSGVCELSQDRLSGPPADVGAIAVSVADISPADNQQAILEKLGDSGRVLQNLFLEVEAKLEFAGRQAKWKKTVTMIHSDKSPTVRFCWNLEEFRSVASRSLGWTSDVKPPTSSCNDDSPSSSFVECILRHPTMAVRHLQLTFSDCLGLKLHHCPFSE